MLTKIQPLIIVVRRVRDAGYTPIERDAARPRDSVPMLKTGNLQGADTAQDWGDVQEPTPAHTTDLR